MSNRKVVLKLVKTVKHCDIFMGRCIVRCNHEIRILNSKYTDTPRCWFCKKYTHNIEYTYISKNYNTIKYRVCCLCETKKLCFGCFRETSHCKLTHTRKLLCYKFLLSQKFPKDVIRLITKKVK